MKSTTKKYSQLLPQNILIALDTSLQSSNHLSSNIKIKQQIQSTQFILKNINQLNPNTKINVILAGGVEPQLLTDTILICNRSSQIQLLKTVHPYGKLHFKQTLQKSREYFVSKLNNSQKQILIFYVHSNISQNYEQIIEYISFFMESGIFIIFISLTQNRKTSQIITEICSIYYQQSRFIMNNNQVDVLRILTDQLISTDISQSRCDNNFNQQQQLIQQIIYESIQQQKSKQGNSLFSIKKKQSKYFFQICNKALNQLDFFNNNQGQRNQKSYKQGMKKTIHFPWLKINSKELKEKIIKVEKSYQQLEAISQQIQNKINFKQKIINLQKQVQKCSKSKNQLRQFQNFKKEIKLIKQIKQIKSEIYKQNKIQISQEKFQDTYHMKHQQLSEKIEQLNKCFYILSNKYSDLNEKFNQPKIIKKLKRKLKSQNQTNNQITLLIKQQNLNIKIFQQAKQKLSAQIIKQSQKNQELKEKTLNLTAQNQILKKRIKYYVDKQQLIGIYNQRKILQDLDQFQQCQYYQYLQLNQNQNRFQFGSCKEHQQMEISFLCLHSQCKQKRLLCQKCNKEKHSDHKKIALKKSKENQMGLQLLSLNGFLDNSSHYLSKLQYYHNSVFKFLKSGLRKLEKYQIQMHQYFQPQFKAVSESFNCQSFKQAKNVIKKGYGSINDDQKIEHYAQSLNILSQSDKRDFRKILNLKIFSQYSSEMLTKIIDKCFKKINQIFEQMIKQSKTYTIFNVGLDKEAFNHCYPCQAIKVKFQNLNLSDKFKQKIVKNVRLKSLIQQINYEQQIDFAPIKSKFIIKDIISMQQIRKINIKWAQNMNANIFQEIAAVQQRNLRLVQLRIQIFHEKLPEGCFQKISKFYPNLKCFYYYVDWRLNHQQYFESQTFTNIFHQTYSLEKKQLKHLSKMKYLTNFWAGFKDYSELNVFQNMINLTDLYLGSRQGSNICNDQQKQFIQTKLTKLKSLKAHNSLRCNLMKVISNNKDLQYLHLIELYLDEKLENFIINDCPKIKFLHLQNLKEIKGYSFLKLKYLKSLSIPRCYQVKVETLIKATQNLTQLQYLDIHDNHFFRAYGSTCSPGKQLIKAIGARLKNLYFLNISSTDANNEIINLLQGLKKLKAFICGNNQITGNSLVKLSKRTKISKLSIKGLLEVTGEDIFSIDKNTILTHLHITKCFQIKSQSILQLKNLKSIKTDFSHFNEDQIKSIKKKGITIHLT